MSDRSPKSNRIAELRKQRGLTQQQLADLVDVHWITISKLERGITRLSEEWRERLAKAFDVDVYDISPREKVLPWVHVEGRLFEDGSVDDITADEQQQFQISSAYFINPDYRWLEVGDNAFWPWLQPGDLVCMAALQIDELESHVGRLCAGWFDIEGVEAMAVGILEIGSTRGTFTIQRIGQPPIRDVKLTSASVFAMTLYDVLSGRAAIRHIAD